MAPKEGLHSKHPSVVLLLQSFLIVTVCGLYTHSPKLGSSLTPLENSSWVSDDHVFAFGFVDEGGKSYSLSIYYLQLPTKTVVWTANCGHPVSSNASLELNSAGLVLSDGAAEVWTADSRVWQGVTSATVSKTGQLVLLDNAAKPLWQSSDFLTDTLVPGQNMPEDAKLAAANGRYVLQMQNDGNLVLFFLGSLMGNEDGVPIGMPYWSSNTVNITAAVFDTSGNFKVLDPSGTVAAYLFEIATSEPGPKRLQLTELGLLTLYVWKRDGQFWSALARIPANPCQVTAQCGPYGICKLSSDRIHHWCECPHGFSFLVNNSWVDGCKPDIPFDYSSGTKLVRLPGIQYSGPKNSSRKYYFTMLSNVTEQECMEYCFKYLYCMAAQFSDPDCLIKTVGHIHTGNNLNQSAVTYLKVSLFESSSNNSLLQQQAPVEPEKSHPSTITTVGVSSAFALCAALILGHLGWCYVWRKHWRYEDIGSDDIEEISGYDAIPRAPLRLSFRELQVATNRFREQLGKGGFGCVYKGVLAGGSPVAVKQLESLNQGLKQFQAEVAIIGAIHHINLVRLLGFCAGASRKLLVYEFMENGSLDKYLFRSADEEHPRHDHNDHTLDWNTRFVVALGTAKAISYLHEECTPSIIHCDIKPENILLGTDFSPKVSDFGLAKLIAGDNVGSISSVRGTTGYMAPEWISSTHITGKVDAYSYGIVLLEIISGRRSLDLEQRISRIIYPEWAYQELRLGNIGLMLDPTLEGQADMEQLERMAKIAFWCIQKDPNSRPSMNRVIQMLEGTVAVPQPPPPYDGYSVERPVDFPDGTGSPAALTDSL